MRSRWDQRIKLGKIKKRNGDDGRMGDESKSEKRRETKSNNYSCEPIVGIEAFARLVLV